MVISYRFHNLPYMQIVRKGIVQVLLKLQSQIFLSLYDEFNHLLEEEGIHVEKGIFGADMKIELLNDGPITICLDSEELF